MNSLDERALEEYLTRLHGSPVRLTRLSTTPPGSEAESGPKGFGYGRPLFLEYTHQSTHVSAVMETMKGDSFGHDFLADRAQNVILAHSTYGNLPSHAKSIDAGIITKAHALRSVGDAEEYFQLVEFVKGEEYFHDLEQIKSSGEVTSQDLQRAEALADYLSEIHSHKHDAPQLYVRRIRELVGHGECIMGLIDSYPQNSTLISQGDLEEIERKCVSWRYRLKEKTFRLSRVHGDFHPWNILFRQGTDFSVIDRSRGEWGEPADDLAALTINYLFYSLQTFGEFREPFLKLWTTFFSRYLQKSGDEDLLSAIQPFYAWRGLVIASPIWYPSLPPGVRETIFTFIHNILETEMMDYKQVQSLLKPKS